MTAMGGHRALRVGACLSLTGRFSRFGVQAAHGLEAWRVLDGRSEIVLADDGSDPTGLEPCLYAMAGRCDLLLGPYSTQLMRVACRVAVDLDRVVWNHGGSGDDVERAAPGRIVSILTPTSRYAEPFLRHLAGQSTQVPLWLVEGKGSFGRQVVAGAAAVAKQVGLRAIRLGPADDLPADRPPAAWDLFCAGSFEEDVARANAALADEDPEVLNLRRQIGLLLASSGDLAGAERMLRELHTEMTRLLGEDHAEVRDLRDVLQRVSTYARTDAKG